jgi:hypothetical protein
MSKLIMRKLSSSSLISLGNYDPIFTLLPGSSNGISISSFVGFLWLSVASSQRSISTDKVSLLLVLGFMS